MPDPSDLALVTALAAAADLQLTEERREQLAPTLRAWLTAANELSRTMAAPGHQDVVPVTVFTHSSDAAPVTR